MNNSAPRNVATSSRGRDSALIAFAFTFTLAFAFTFTLAFAFTFAFAFTLAFAFAFAFTVNG